MTESPANWRSTVIVSVLSMFCGVVVGSWWVSNLRAPESDAYDPRDADLEALVARSQRSTQLDPSAAPSARTPSDSAGSGGQPRTGSSMQTIVGDLASRAVGVVAGEWLPSSGGELILTGESGAPIWHRARWERRGNAPREVVLELERASWPALLTADRERLTTLRPLGDPPWDDAVFSVIGAVSAVGAVTGRDFTVSASPETSLTEICRALGTREEELSDDQRSTAMLRLREWEIAERRRFVRLSELLAQVMDDDRGTSADVIGYVTAGGEVQLAQREQHQTLLRLLAAAAEREAQFVRRARELVR